MRRSALLLLSLCLSLPGISQDLEKPIYIRHGELNESISSQEALEADPKEIWEGSYYRIMQFEEVLNSDQQHSLRQFGINILAYLPEDAYICALISADHDLKKLRKLGLIRVLKLNESHKVKSEILSGAFPEWSIHQEGHVELDLRVFPNVETEKARTFLEQNEYLLSNIPSFPGSINLSVPFGKVKELCKLPFVYSVEATGAIPEHDDLPGRSLHRSTSINGLHTNSLKYDGSGISMAIADDGANGPHIDFNGRQTQYNQDIGGTHGDMTNGIAVGAGNIQPNFAGMASGAYLYTYNISNYPHIRLADSNFLQRKVVITSTSYSQSPRGGFYENTAAQIDEQVYSYPELLHVFSAGNDGTQDHGYGAGSLWGNITGGRKAAKNVIATGNLNSKDALERSSSRGPARDGRIKPDLCANGIGQMSTGPNYTYRVGGGTSAAAPGIAGVSAQLKHAHLDLYGQRAESALIKGALMNTAEDLGRPGPDFDHGWGRINALKAYELIRDGRFKAASLQHGDSTVLNITVSPGQAELRAMIHWTDPAGSPLAAKALVNDIDLVLEDPSGNRYRPFVLDPTPDTLKLASNAIPGIDSLNNTEQVVIRNPDAGQYRLIAYGKNIAMGPQKFYFLYEANSARPRITYPIGGEQFDPFEVQIIRWDATPDSNTFSIDVSYDAGQVWQSLSTSIPANLRYYDYQVPDSLSGQVLFRITRNNLSTVSDTFLNIMRSANGLSLDRVCPDSVELSWLPTIGATAYTIYKLGQKYMEPISSSTTPNIVLKRHDTENETWLAVQATNGNIVSRRSEAVRVLKGLNNCQLATDVAITKLLSTSGAIHFDCLSIDSADLTIDVQNLGTDTAKNVLIFAEIAGRLIVQDTIPLLSPGQSISRNYLKVVRVTGSNLISATIQLTGDQNDYNNSSFIQVNSLKGKDYSIPYMQDFEEFDLCRTDNNCEVIKCYLGSGWRNAVNLVEDDVDWRIDELGTPTRDTGPGSDHTPGPGRENYLYLESNSCNNKTAILYSPCLDLTAASMPELSFWVHMNGNNIGSLHVDLISEKGIEEDVLPVLTGSQGNMWIQRRYILSQYVGQVVVFRIRGELANGAQGDMAIDDFEIIETARFTKDAAALKVLRPLLGNYQACTDLSQEPIEIEIRNAGFDTIFTLNVYHDVNKGASIRDSFNLVLPPLKDTILTLQNQINLSAAGPLDLRIWTDLEDEQFRYNDTLHFPIVVHQSKVFKLPFEENFEKGNLCSTASNCENTACPIPDWIQEENLIFDDIDLRLNATGTPSGGTGPSDDHTPGVGKVKYLYTEASNGCYAKNASLISPCIDLRGSRKPVLRFWYHMSGNNIGSLQLDLVADSLHFDIMPAVIGSQGNQWLEAVVDLSQWKDEIINLRFNMTTGASWSGDIAIDDISIEEEHQYQHDVGVLKVFSPLPSEYFACNGPDSVQIEMDLWNWGTSPTGFVPFAIQVDQQAIQRDSVFNIPSAGGFSILGSSSILLDISQPGTHLIKAWTEYALDSNATNDTITFQLRTIAGQIVQAPFVQSFDSMTQCSTSANCEAVSCLLEEGWLNSENDAFDNIDWRTRAGGTPTNGTGPSGDLNVGGNYLYTEASGAAGGCINREASLLSPCIDLSTVILPRLKFWYNMSGAQMGSLEVDLFDGERWHTNIGPLLQGNQGASWRPVEIVLSSFLGKTINLRFRGITGNGIGSDLAIDHISIDEAFSSSIKLSGPLCADSTVCVEALGEQTLTNYNFILKIGAISIPYSGPGPHCLKLPASGTAQVILTASLAGNIERDTLLVSVTPRTMADYAYSINTNTVQFSDSSINADTWYWDFGDGDTSSMQNPRHTYAQFRPYVVMQMVENSCNRDTVFKQIRLNVGLPDLSAENLNIYPNPAKSMLYLEGEGLEHYKELRVHDALGRFILRQSLNGSYAKIDLNEIAAGTYVLRLAGKDRQKVLRFIRL